ncbi:MAG TPA: PHP domain-containing protein [Acidimicrobiia bacterium]|nr:PHP domain-containing protein [Acidimicrobiia bacterium]
MSDPREVPRRTFARLLWRLAELTRASEARRSFRSKAFARAVWSLDEFPVSLGMDRDEMLRVDGIGPGVAGLIEEFEETGRISTLERLERELPSEAGRFRRLPRMSPRIQRDLKSRRIETRAELRLALASDEFVDSVAGLGRATADLWAGILSMPPSATAAPAHEAWVTASSLASHVAEHTAAWVDVAGEVRTVAEWVEELLLVVTTSDYELAHEFLATTAVLGSVAAEANKRITGVSLSGMRVVIELAAPEESGTALVRATGPPAHLTIADDTAFSTEHEVYEAAGYPWIPPAARSLPMDLGSQVVFVEELRGDLHLHSEASPDGRLSLDDIAAEADERGYEYVLITDHTIGLRFGGLDSEALRRQALAIQAVQERHDVRILHGAELNIGPSGGLDVDDDTLHLLDFAVAGVHSHFSQTRAQQTARLVTAMTHPVVKILAHPLGRRIGIRPAIDVDLEQVIDVAIAQQVALEVNGHRDRLDLPRHAIEEAAWKGALFAANSDAHRRAEIGNVENAVAVLQGAGVRGDQIVNCWPFADLETWSQRANMRVG